MFKEFLRNLRTRFNFKSLFRRKRRQPIRWHNPRVEWLEDRRLLSGDILLTVDAMRSLLAPHLHAIEYVTVVTHGYQPPIVGDGDALYDLAKDIQKVAMDVNSNLASLTGQPTAPAWLL